MGLKIWGLHVRLSSGLNLTAACAKLVFATTERPYFVRLCGIATYRLGAEEASTRRLKVDLSSNAG